MKAAEILRKLADVIDSQETDAQTGTEITNRPDQASVEVEQPTDTQDIEQQAQVNTRSMVAPLQQKLDLMKQLAGVEEPCDACGSTPCGCEQPDELAIMRQNAGIKPVVMAIADEDEPFEG